MKLSEDTIKRLKKLNEDMIVIKKQIEELTEKRYEMVKKTIKLLNKLDTITVEIEKLTKEDNLKGDNK